MSPMLAGEGGNRNEQRIMLAHGMLWTVVVTVLVRFTGTEPVILKYPRGWIGAVAFAPDSRRLAIGASDGSVSIWDARAGKQLATLQGHEDAVAALAWSLDGDTLVSGGHDRVAMIHRLGQEKASTRQILRGHDGAVLSIALSSDGRRLYTASIDATIREWETESGRPTNVLRGHTSWVNSLALSQADAELASASSDNTIALRRLPNLNTLQTFGVKEGEVRAVALSADGKWVAAGVRYGGVRIWNRQENRDAAALNAHVGETWAVAFTPNGEVLASGGGDWNQPGQVRLWSVGTWKLRATLPHSGEVLCVAVSPDGRWLAAGSWNRTVRIWDLRPYSKACKP